MIEKKKAKRFTPEEMQKIVKAASKSANRDRAFKKMGLDPNFEYAIDKTKSGHARIQPIRRIKKK